MLQDEDRVLLVLGPERALDVLPDEEALRAETGGEPRGRSL